MNKQNDKIETLFDLLPEKVKYMIAVNMWYSQSKLPKHDDNFDEHLRRQREKRLQRITDEILKINVRIIR